VLVGVGLAFMAQMAGAHALSWAVGAYLPLSTTFPIWIGGMVKALADRVAHRKQESELSSGMLYATGLVAGGSLGGVLIALVAFFGDSVLKMEKPTLLERIDVGNLIPAYGSFKNDAVWGGILCAAVFGVLCWRLFRNAQKTIDT
jgi:hypothetical protein